MEALNDQLKNAYLAGLLDGEGSIGFGSVRKGYRPAKLVMTMTDKDTMQWVVDYTKVGKLREYLPTSPSGGACKIAYRWEVYALKAVPILIAVRPYLITKAKRADEVLKFYKQRTKDPQYMARYGHHWIGLEQWIVNGQK